jgi:hypothetical protein
MRGFLKFYLLSIAAFSTSAATLNLSTGSTSGANFVGGGWQINGAPAVVLTGTLPFTTSFPGFGWMGSPGQWIGATPTDGNYQIAGNCNSAAPTNACGALPGTRVYTLTWSTIHGGFLAIQGVTGDNGVRGGVPVNTSFQVLLDGTPAFSTFSASQNAMSQTAAPDGTISNGSPVITYGSGTVVTLRAIIVNDQMVPGDTTTRNPSGLIVYANGFAFETPEPSTLAMLGLGAIICAPFLHGRHSRRRNGAEQKV